MGFEMRRGELSLWAAGPGVGKSLVAMKIALFSGVPTLYISADTNRTEQTERAALCMGWDGRSTDGFIEALALIPENVRFSFESSPSIKDCVAECEAYAVVFGEFPQLIVVDTLGKIWTESSDEHVRNKEATESCQDLARETDAHVMALHHLTKGHDKGDAPAGLDALMSGVSKIPEQVVTMWRDGADRLCLASVKNRSGPADATATRVRAYLQLNFDRMSVDDVIVQQFDFTRDYELQAGVV
jgi:predicted ATP-dependent serine protease